MNYAIRSRQLLFNFILLIKPCKVMAVNVRRLFAFWANCHDAESWADRFGTTWNPTDIPFEKRYSLPQTSTPLCHNPKPILEMNLAPPVLLSEYTFKLTARFIVLETFAQRWTSLLTTPMTNHSWIYFAKSNAMRCMISHGKYSKTFLRHDGDR